MSNFELSVLFFLQLAVILGVIRLVGVAAKKIGQPQVVGEMIAGVLLGPSLLGWMMPQIHTSLFPQASHTILFAVAQVGVALYMFLVGTEFDTSLIRTRIKSAFSVSLAGMITPFALGAAVAYLFGHGFDLFAPDVARWEAMLFMGAAMCITAFPMLARIIYERGLSGTSLGTLALAAGSIDDVSAWCVLAIVLASFMQQPLIAVFAIGGGALYVLTVLTIGRRLLTRLTPAVEKHSFMTNPILGFILMLVMFGSWVTDSLGIYAVFGAFILGTAMPRGIVTKELQRLLEPMTTNFLLPLFFIYSGLNTQLGLVSTPTLWLITLLVIAAACVGKGVACWAAARLNGESNREALAIGTLMNARGLMELIILNIGLERGIITPTLFTIMVIMAIATTLMASPVFEYVYDRHLKSRTTPLTVVPLPAKS